MSEQNVDVEESRYTEQFGDYLKRHREASSLSLDSIAKNTRIAKRFLQAFEEGDIQKFPDDAFARGFLKVYARELGLETDEVIARYDQLKRSLMPTQIRTVKKQIEPAAGFSDFAKSRWVWMGLTIVLGFALVVGLAQMLMRGKKTTESASPPEMADVMEAPLPLTTETPAKTSNSVIIEPPLVQTQDAPAAATETAVPVKPSILTVTALKNSDFSFRVDEKISETITLKAGESQAIHVQREIEMTFADRSAFQLNYNGKPVQVTGTTVKLFNRNLFLKR